MSPTVLDQLRELGPVFRSGDAVAAGVSWRDLYALRDAGELVELSRGVFQLADVGIDRADFAAVCVRVPEAMVCLDSALEHWGLTDELPRSVHVAVPSSSHRPTIDHPPTTVHQFQADTFDIGRVEVIGAVGERFWISDRERTVVDTFRLRHLVGEDLALQALASWWRGQPRDIPHLTALGQTLGGWPAIYDALQVLQA